MATSIGWSRQLCEAMTAGYKSRLTRPLRGDGPHGLVVRGFSPPSVIRPSVQWRGVLHQPQSMSTALDLPAHAFDRTPAVLLGGVNLVRTLGMAGIPVIVASHLEEEP